MTIKNKEILIIGSNSAIIQDTIKFYLKRKVKVIGVSKSKERNENFKKDNNFHFYKFDLLKNFNKIYDLCKKINKKHKNISVIIFAQGGSFGKNKILSNSNIWENIWKINFGSTLAINNFFIKKFIKFLSVQSLK